MKRYLDTHRLASRVLSLALMASLALPLPTLAASVALATAPLTNATTTSVLPNLMFILDNSGSMGQDYTPDYLMDYSASTAGGRNPWTYAAYDSNYWYSIGDAEKNCKDSADDDGSLSTALSSMDLCVVGDVPYMTGAINSQYYNPAILYSPGVNSDGTSKPSQTNPASVLTDGYNKQNKTQLNVSLTTINLTTSYPDRVWCKNTGDLPTGPDCVKNSDYSYPNATYKYGRDASKYVKGVYGAPYYYDVVPTEYCTAADLKSCTLTSIPTGAYTFPAKSRWCSDTALTVCQATKTATYKYPRYVGASTTAVAASGTIAVGGTSKNQNVSSMKINGIEILGATVSWGNTEDDAGFAAAIKNQINAYVSNPEYTASVSGTTITVTSTLAAGASANGDIVITKSADPTFTMALIPDIKGGVTGFSTPPYTFVRTDLVAPVAPAVGSYPKAATRTDCAGATCTYAEEVTNFGNWYAYYRTRMQGMKSAASKAFRTIDNRYRVGFYTINSPSTNYLPIAKFDNLSSGSEAVLQKSTWYSRLFNATPGSSTPLRSALSTVGRIFAGQKPIGTADPMQYSCQQNFTLLTTDGYWNTDSASDVKDLAGNAIGNLDASPVTRPMYEGPTATSATLADAAKYYYDTDLRTTALGNCTGSLGLDVCDDNVFVSSTDNNPKQHMTTFTLGLGVDGILTFSSDYKSVKDLTAPPADARLDYYNLFYGTGTPVMNWPVPVSGNETTVDDLWHAAVNGQGTYFSAKDPAQLSSGLNDALAQIGSKLGSGAAAATSTLDITPGDNYAYLATYTTVKWTGNLEARSIDVNTGEPSLSATWCAEDVVAGACAAPGSIVAEVSGASTLYYCVTPVPTPADCEAPGILDGTNCKVQVPTSCTGTMAARVHASSDDRTIYTKVGAGLGDFVAANLNLALFDSSDLSQWSLLSSTQQAKATPEAMVNFLRGQTGNEDRSVNPIDDRVFRYREAVLGDVVESRPFFVGKPIFSYTDAGYSAFVSSNASRARTVYMGANDGMLHAFNADTGQERWAYVPSMVIPNMWKLADKNYATMHNYYVNGNPVVGDVFDGGSWRTILVAGLNGGGRGYYALDVTNPANPSLLWEFTSNSADALYDLDLGYSFGQPVITKKADGTWVVLLTSGYNNTSPGTGQGYLYVRNALTGASISKTSTGVGDTTTPSGLARIATWADDPEKNNTAGYTYGGDLLGNLWRFDINTGAVMKFAELKDPAGSPQPITTRPTLGKVDDKHVVFVATGKYLESSDLTDTQKQSLYAIKDDNATVTLVNPRTTLVEQILTNNANERTVTANSVNFSVQRGWYVDFPDSGERSNVNPLLAWGVLVAPTIVPTSSVCSPGGYGWLNYFDYKTGGLVPDAQDGLAGQRFDSPIVGITPVRKSDGSGELLITKGDGGLEKPRKRVTPSGNTSGFTAKRVIWRELVQ